jgi:hypothetical protein
MMTATTQAPIANNREKWIIPVREAEHVSNDFKLVSQDIENKTGSDITLATTLTELVDTLDRFLRQAKKEDKYMPLSYADKSDAVLVDTLDRFLRQAKKEDKYMPLSYADKSDAVHLHRGIDPINDISYMRLDPWEDDHARKNGTYEVKEILQVSIPIDSITSSCPPALKDYTLSIDFQNSEIKEVKLWRLDTRHPITAAAYVEASQLLSVFDTRDEFMKSIVSFLAEAVYQASVNCERVVDSLKTKVHEYFT